MYALKKEEELTAGCLISEVHAVCTAITFEALSDAVTTITLKVSRMAGPQLYNTVRATNITLHTRVSGLHKQDKNTA